MAPTNSSSRLASDTPLVVAGLTETERASIITKAAEAASGLLAIFEMPGLMEVFVNETGRRWLNAGQHINTGPITLLDIISIDDEQRLQQEMLPQAQVLGQWRGTCHLRDNWGNEFPVEAVITSHQNNRTHYLCLQANRHILTNPEDGAVGDRELLRALLDNAPDTIYFKDLHSRLLRTSRSMALKCGRPDSAAMIGITDFDLFSTEHAQQAYEDEQNIVRTGTPVIDKEEKETWPDGRVTWVSSTKLPLQDGEGNTVGTFGVSRDITFRKAAEEERKELLAQLQLAQKLESIGRLAAGVAHEINTPTQFISDNTHFLSSAFGKLTKLLHCYRALQAATAVQGLLPNETENVAAQEKKIELDYLLKEIPNTIQQTLDGLGRVTKIVRSLKEFSHPDNSQCTAVDLNRVIETAINVARHEWKYVAEMVTDLDPALASVPCVVDEFNQVLLNLLINATHAIESALKAQPESTTRGTITVRTRREEDWALVEISDTGTGIPQDIQHRIFEPFFTTKEIGKGTGQGLNLVHTIIVKHHQGTIKFTTTVGRGTTFHIRLPYNPPHPKK